MNVRLCVGRRAERNADVRRDPLVADRHGDAVQYLLRCQHAQGALCLRRPARAEPFQDGLLARPQAAERLRLVRRCGEIAGRQIRGVKPRRDPPTRLNIQPDRLRPGNCAGDPAVAVRQAEVRRAVRKHRRARGGAPAGGELCLVKAKRRKCVPQEQPRPREVARLCPAERRLHAGPPFRRKQLERGKRQSRRLHIKNRYAIFQ